MAETTYDLVVIGSGPGGYVAAIRAAQLGFRTALVEKDATLGGTCLNVGCIPSKALLESTALLEEAQKNLSKHGLRLGQVEVDLAQLLERKNIIVRQVTGGVAGLVKKNAIDLHAGFGRIGAADTVLVDGAGGTTNALKTRRILIATGSVPTTLPGIELDGDRVVTSTEALTFPAVPKHLVVIGAGVIGLELGSVWRRLGAQVTVLEYLDRVLPGMDGEVAAAAKKIFERQGMKFLLQSKVTGARKTGPESALVEFTDAAGQVQQLECERVLVCVGRRAFPDRLGLAELGVELDRRGRIVVDKHWATSVPGVYAIGDVIAGPMLAHKASEEGVAAVEYMATGVGHVNYDAIPSVVYTSPEVAGVGRTEEELQQAGSAYRKGTFPFVAIARAKAIGHTDGFVKILADAKTDRVLGAHIIGHHAGDLVAEVAVAMEFGTSAEDLARASHAHPSMAEAIKEAALAVAGRALHA
jgi:dihydrolipoamide dehydrogenase